MELTAVSLAEQPEARAAINHISTGAWPEFALHDPVSNRFWPRLSTDFAAFQLVLFTPDGATVAVANTIPLHWDGAVDGLPEGWDAALELGCRQAEQGVEPDTLCALAAIVGREHQGRGVSAGVLRAMTACAGRHGLTSLIAPVRPTQKCRYPLIPMERYARWTREDGSHFDPWIRVHQRLGAEMLGVSPCAMYIPGTVEQWEAWTGMALPESGEYVVPEALNPITVDRESDRVDYIEPAIWMRHRVEGRCPQ